MHEAAYNLSVLLAHDHPRESIELLLNAFELNANPKYGYTLAFYMNQNRDPERAADMLRFVIQQWPTYTDAYLLLGDIHEEQGNIEEARGVYQQALSTEGVSRRNRYRLETKLQALKTTEASKERR